MDQSGVAPPLPKRPKDATPDEKWAYYKAQTARLTAAAEGKEFVPEPIEDESGKPVDVNAGWGNDTGWWGEDTSVPLLEVTVDRRNGELINLRFVPRKDVLNVVATPRESRAAGSRRRNTRTRPRKPRGPDGDSEPPPERELDRLAGFQAASARMVARVGRRRAATRGLA